MKRRRSSFACKSKTSELRTSKNKEGKMKSRKRISVYALVIGLGMAAVSDAVIVGINSENGIPNSSGDYTNLTAAALTEAGVTYNTNLSVDTVGDVLTGAFNTFTVLPEKRMTFKVTLQAGTYELYLRGCATENIGLSLGGSDDALAANNNSLYVIESLTADSRIADDYAKIDVPTTVFPANELLWVNLSAAFSAIPDYTVASSGTYLVSIIGREDGFLVDGLAFVTKDQTVTFEELDVAVQSDPAWVESPVGINSDIGVANTDTNWTVLTESTLTDAGVTYNSNLTATTFGTVLTPLCSPLAAVAEKRISFSADLQAGTYDLYLRGCNTANLGLSMGGGLDELYGENNSFYVLGDLNADPQAAGNYTMVGSAVVVFPANEMVWANLSAAFSAVPVYIASSNGTYSISLLPREDGFLIDALAFVPSDQPLTMSELDALFASEIGSLSMETQGAGAVFSWPGQVGVSYSLQKSDDLLSGVWANVATGLVASGDAVTVTNSMDEDAAFFRAVVE
jgi:hypothetical protein